MHIFHKWTKWRKEPGFYHSYWGGTIDNTYVQTRDCKSCGKTQVKSI